MIKHFAKKRAPFRAAQWTGSMTPDVQELLQHRAAGIVSDENIHVVDQELRLGNGSVQQLRLGGWRAEIGDWVMSTPDGLSVVPDVAFRANFEEVDEAGRVWPSADEHEQAGRAFIQELDALLLAGLRLSAEEHVGIFRGREHLVFTLRRLLEDHAYVARQHELARIRAKINKEL